MNTYSFSLVDAPGVAAANRFLSVFNPAASGKRLYLLRLAVISYSIAVSLTRNSLRLTRITAASGGALQAASVINKFRTGFSNPVAEVRITNPTVTLTAEIDAFPPNQLATVAGTTGVDRQVADFTSLLMHSRMEFLEGEGWAVHQTIAGDTDQTYVIVPTWSEALNP